MHHEFVDAVRGGAQTFDQILHNSSSYVYPG